MAEKEEKKSSAVGGGMIFVGCLMLGMGIGFLYNQIVVGLFIGMGAGFIFGAIFKK